MTHASIRATWRPTGRPTRRPIVRTALRRGSALGLCLGLAALAAPGCGAPDDDGAADAPATTNATAASAPDTTRAGGDEMFFKKKDDGLLAVGSQAPAFSVPDQDGKVRTLAEFKGQRVLLWFYPKADTPGCTVEGKGFRDRSAQTKDVGVILGVSFDTPAENKAFAQKFGFEYPLLCDTTRELGLAYKAAKSKDAQYADRITYIIDADGKIEFAEKVTDIPAHVDAAVARLCDV